MLFIFVPEQKFISARISDVTKRRLARACAAAVPYAVDGAGVMVGVSPERCWTELRVHPLRYELHAADWDTEHREETD